jgi:hypothetical protein
MTPQELQQIKDTIEQSIGTSGIREMQQAFQKHIQDDAVMDEIVRQHIHDMEPVKKLGDTMIAMGRGATYMAGLGVGLAAVVTAIVEIFKKVK